MIFKKSSGVLTEEVAVNKEKSRYILNTSTGVPVVQVHRSKDVKNTRI